MNFIKRVLNAENGRQGSSYTKPLALVRFNLFVLAFFSLELTHLPPGCSLKVPLPVSLSVPLPLPCPTVTPAMVRSGRMLHVALVLTLRYLSGV
jgi:hypothetical protein